MEIFNDIKMTEVGNTPLIELSVGKGKIYTKLECTNPCGSIKDRIAKYIIEESEKQGLLKPGMTIVEASSGNTGISLTYFGVKKGYEVIIVMPSNMTKERQDRIKSLGGRLILCEKDNFEQAAEIRNGFSEKDPGKFFNPDQFSNPLNTECHQKTTGQEILQQMEYYSKEINAFVAGVGTGGTLIGVGKAIREKYSRAAIVAVEPSESAVMSGEPPGPHGIPGIGDGFIPYIGTDGNGKLNELIDGVIKIKSEQAKQAAQMLETKYGCCVGISSGANYLAAKRLIKKSGLESIVTIFPDGFTNYKTKGLQHCQEGTCKYEDKRSPVF